MVECGGAGLEQSGTGVGSSAISDKGGVVDSGDSTSGEGGMGVVVGVGKEVGVTVGAGVGEGAGGCLSWRGCEVER